MVKLPKKLLVSLTDQQIAELDILVEKGIYKNRSEAIRSAVRLLLEKAKLEQLEEKLKK